jgi:hypothetical protein
MLKICNHTASHYTNELDLTFFNCSIPQKKQMLKNCSDFGFSD